MSQNEPEKIWLEVRNGTPHDLNFARNLKKFTKQTAF